MHIYVAYTIEIGYPPPHCLVILMRIKKFTRITHGIKKIFILILY